jgi:hypothetical protein
MSNKYTLAQALTQPDDTTLDLVGVVITKAESKTTKTGKPYASCIVEGDGQRTYLNIFGPVPNVLNTPVNIASVKIGSFNGKRNFTGGKFTVIGRDGETAPRPIPTDAQNQAFPTGHTNAVHGATAGMAVKAAVDIWLQEKKPWDEASTKFIYARAKQIVEISQAIESGKPLSEEVPF